MERSYLQINIVNLISVTIMAAVGITVIGFAGSALAKYRQGS